MSGNPALGTTVNIVLRDKTLSLEVVALSPQTSLTSAEGFSPVIVSIDGQDNTFWHKSTGMGLPYWEWPEVAKEEVEE